MINYSGSRGQRIQQRIVTKWPQDGTEFIYSNRAGGSKIADQDKTRKRNPGKYIRFSSETPKVLTTIVMKGQSRMISPQEAWNPTQVISDLDLIFFFFFASSLFPKGKLNHL